MRARVFSWQQVSFFVGGGLGLAIGGVVGATSAGGGPSPSSASPASSSPSPSSALREPRGEADLPETMTWEQIEALPPAPVDTVKGSEGLSFGQFLRIATKELISQLRMIFGIRTMRYVLVGVGALLFTVAGIGTWLAIYHERYSGMTAGEAVVLTGGILGIGGLIGTLGGGWFSDRFHSRWKGGRIVIVVWSGVFCAVLFMISFLVDPVWLRVTLEFIGIIAAGGAAPGLRAAMLDVIPAESRGVGASAMALTTALFGNALAPVLVGWISDVTGSLVVAFFIVFPPVIVGLLLLLRARHTLDDDARAIVTAIFEEQQMLEEERIRLEVLHQADGHEGGGAPAVVTGAGDARAGRRRTHGAGRRRGRPDVGVRPGLSAAADEHAGDRAGGGGGARPAYPRGARRPHAARVGPSMDQREGRP